MTGHASHQSLSQKWLQLAAQHAKLAQSKKDHWTSEDGKFEQCALAAATREDPTTSYRAKQISFTFEVRAAATGWGAPSIATATLQGNG